MNTSGTDSAPTSFDREVKKRFGSSSFWVKKGIKYATGVGLLYDISLGLVMAQRTKHDPTVKSIRFVSENPEEKFFTTLKDFRFHDRLNKNRKRCKEVEIEELLNESEGTALDFKRCRRS